MTIRLFILACLFWALSVRTPDHDVATTSDEDFLKGAAINAIGELRLGELAIHRTEKQLIRDFARRMLTAYSQASKEVQELADQKGIACPAELDEKHKEMLEGLARLSGHEFDRAYMTEIIASHEAEIKEFEDHGAAGRDREIKKWISRTLPKLREHLQVARETRRQTDMVTE
ncbi:MAG: DUF4142 domain-containing protein [Acidobacteria bacterium]|nr:MAG: DUF4142 domain-containing protein [Acidobacteriota bacterium]